jgi:hypothetical protein
MRGRARWLVMAVGALLALGGLLAVLPAGAGASSPPAEPETEPVEFTPTGVKLKGSLNPEGVPTYYYFIYQEAGAAECEDEWGCAPSTPREGPLTGSASQAVSAEVQFTHLRPGKTYFYWLVAEQESEAGAKRGSRSSAGQFVVPAPRIGSESVSHVTSTDATLEAEISPGDRAARYQFQIAKSPSELRSEIVCPTKVGPPFICVGEHVESALPLGYIPSEYEDHWEYIAVNGHNARLDLASAGVALQPDTTYYYRVLAAPSILTEDTIAWEGPAVIGPEQTFTTLPKGKAPVIESVKVSHLTKTDATLEATIDTEGQETEYGFQLSLSPCSKKGAGCEVIVEVRLPCCGSLYGSFVPQTVSLDLNSAGVVLGEGEYSFGVTAWNEAGKTSASGGVFEAAEEPKVEPLSSTHGSTAGQPASGGGQTPGSPTSSSTAATAGGASGFATADLVPRGEKTKPHAKPHKTKHRKHKPRKAKGNGKAHAGRRR